LLIDDAVGSGATLNQVAGKIKDKGVAQKITGLALVGSFKGFDVITDV
jgi:predicted amidophosphoribosyltransferase